MDDLDDVVEEFLIESYENLDQLERDLVALEENPSEPSLIASIFRTIHTIKGTCGFLGYGKLEAITHAGENLLSRIREGQLLLDADIATGLLEQVDAVREILGEIERTGAEGDGVYDATVQRLEMLTTGACTEPDTSALGDRGPTGEGSPAAPVVAQAAERQVASGDDALELPSGFAHPDTPNASSQLPSLSGMSVVAGETGAGFSTPVASVLVPETASGNRQAPNHVAESSIRVSVDVLDRLMNLVGELVLARNQILRLADDSRDPALLATTQRLNQVTGELQEGVMTTRMQPIGNVWSKVPRVVRDLARACHKRVRVEMEGEETGLDKTLIEAIKDPLTHLIRNAVDHGIEAPDVRQAAGKEPEGTLALRAYHEGGQVNIEIADDGGGIDPDKLVQRALEKGLVTAEQATRLTPRQGLNLLFLPGFSTAEQVTNLSGRGVGMDVVKTNVERIGGAIDISTSVGQGTTFKVKIPLTLAIIPALIVRSYEQRYAIPQVNLLELVRIEGGSPDLRAIHGAPVFMLRGRLLPILRLHEELGLMACPSGAEADDGEGGLQHIVVLQADDQRFGLVVDEVQDSEEIVVKPLGEHIKAIGAFAGATIMGDGQVALILDVVGLAHRGGVVGRGEDHEAVEVAADGLTEIDESTSLLLTEGRDRVCAIPLERVTRLEEAAVDDIELIGDRQVLQYRGGILPLIYADPEDMELVGAESLQIVVFETRGHLVGAVVRRIVDILTEHLEVRRVGACQGVAGTAIVGERVVEVIDLDGLADARGVVLPTQPPAMGISA